MNDDLKNVRDLLHRAGTSALRAKHCIDPKQNLDRGIDQAQLYIHAAESLLRRARAALIRDPQLRADALADAPEPE